MTDFIIHRLPNGEMDVSARRAEPAPAPAQRHYEINPKPNGGWALKVYEDAEEIGGGSFPPGDDGYQDALDMAAEMSAMPTPTPAPARKAVPIAKRKADHTGRISFENRYWYCVGAEGLIVEISIPEADFTRPQWRAIGGDGWQDCRRADSQPKRLQPDLNRYEQEFLRSLRGGPMESSLLCERWPTHHSSIRLSRLLQAGLIYRKRPATDAPIYLSEAGRAAIVPRNPASVKPRHTPRAAPFVHNPVGRFAAGHYLRE